MLGEYVLILYAICDRTVIDGTNFKLIYNTNVFSIARQFTKQQISPDLEHLLIHVG